MPSLMIDNFELWQQRAVEFRELAGSIEGEDAKQTMLRIAEHYARLAAGADQRPAATLAQAAIVAAPPHALPWALAEAS
jgi:hypothetical protein